MTTVPDSVSRRIPRKAYTDNMVVSVAEVNAFTSSRPKDWRWVTTKSSVGGAAHVLSLLHWLVYWGEGDLLAGMVCRLLTPSQAGTPPSSTIETRYSA